MKRIVMFGVLVASTATAHAQPASAQAQALFKQARDLMADGKIAEGCAVFESSQKLAPAISTLMNLANCREKNHQLASAWGHFVEAERQTRNATTEEELAYWRVVKERATKLEPILSTLRIDVPASVRIDGLSIARGEQVIGIGEWSIALPVDGGTYTITASAPGHESWRATVTVGTELDAKAIGVPPLKVQKVIVKPDPAALANAKPGVPVPSKVPWIVGGSGVVFLGVATGFELAGRATYRDSQREVDDPQQRSLWESANTKRHVAQVFAVAGVGATGIAIWLYIRDRKQRQRVLEVQPMATPDAAGVTIGGVW